jgi:hypothetical protein
MDNVTETLMIEQMGWKNDRALNVEQPINDLALAQVLQWQLMNAMKKEIRRARRLQDRKNVLVLH